MYPAGYHGNYVKWAIEVSDASNQSVTRDPINPHGSHQYGGVGTSHHHPRIPTHQDLNLHDMWYMFNQPKDHKIYLVNSGSQRHDVSEQVARLLLRDPTGIVINLHDNDEDDWAAYGRINCVTKWPTYMAASYQSFHDLAPSFDPFDCGHDMAFRNHVVKTNPLGSCGKPNRARIEEHLQTYDRWFNVRHRYQPHEVNHDTYPCTPDLSRFFDFSLQQIVSHDFPDLVEFLLRCIDVIDHVDVSAVRSVHGNYVDIQPNLSWFDSVQRWQKTGSLDQYLTSHAIVAAEIILKIFRQCDIRFVGESSEANWLYRYNRKVRDPSWPVLTDHREFHDLPAWIQKEMVQIHGIQPLCSKTLFDRFNDWESQHLQDINEIYQKLCCDTVHDSQSYHA